MKELKSVRYIVVHCTATRSNKPFSVEKLINCGVGKYGQCSYHYYVRLDGTVVPLLPESVQGVHARGYNSCSLGVVYEGGVDENGKNKDTRTTEQKHTLYALLKELTRSYPEAHIIGHRELPKQQMPKELVLDWLSLDDSRRSQLPLVAKDCPCFPAFKEYADLQPKSR